MKTLRLAAAMGVTLATMLSLTLSGCGAADNLKDAVKDKADDAAAQVTAAANDLKDKAIEKGVEDVINKLSTNGPQIDIGVDGSASVPGDFPSSLPLPDGDLKVALSEDRKWILTYSIADASAADSLVARFAAEPGYQASDQTEVNGATVWTFTSVDYHVNVALITAVDGTYQLVYGVSATGT